MTDPILEPLNARDFYLGRQPILDRFQGLFGYELLFRGAASGPANIPNDLTATAAVIAHVAQLGLDKVIGESLGFVNVDGEVLKSDIFNFLPKENIVLEVVESTRASDEVIARMQELAGHGFRFALDDVVADSPDVQRFLPLIDYVKLDIADVAPATLRELAPRFRKDHKKLLAEKVETLDEYKSCLELGFDYFQGYYFARPVVMSGKKLSPSQLAIVELMNLITSDAEHADIERAVKGDASLSLNLLRLVNSPAMGAVKPIASLSQALMVLGRRQLQRWLQIMLYAEPNRGNGGGNPLLALATTRGRLLELLSNRLRPHDRERADMAFTVGIMSLMDALFGIPMNEIITQIPVNQDVARALIERDGFLGNLLYLTECVERIEEREEDLLPTLRGLAISTDELVHLEMAAFEWSDRVTRSTH
ncbi:EAL and HDOD domain-containing protein [Massilia sp. TS11]|uniref:EAL and HDOD domain-containing protein n=1 Tax=Massilia sp. TS11 TaxID=2908003 RepID=UPI001EDBD1FA|nr:EAL domain-containing protein [Massilia sp. TS11]MCG2585467.1 EAL domain-containing protein [Massilia sp. TS11]